MAGVNACRDGYEQILSAAGCQSAANATSLASGIWNRASSWSNNPAGCFYDGGSGNGGRNVFFNAHPIGGVNQAGDRTLCQRTKNPKVDVVTIPLPVPIDGTAAYYDRTCAGTDDVLFDTLGGTPTISHADCERRCAGTASCQLYLWGAAAYGDDSNANRCAGYGSCVSRHKSIDHSRAGDVLTEGGAKSTAAMWAPVCPTGKVATEPVPAMLNVTKVNSFAVDRFAASTHYSLLPEGTEDTTMYLVRQLVAGDEMNWTTFIPPTAKPSAKITLVFTGGIGYTSQPATGWDLLVNGKSGVSFDVVIPVSAKWSRSSTSGDVVMEYWPTNPWSIENSQGVFFLQFPITYLDTSRMATISVQARPGAASKRWFAIFRIQRLLEGMMYAAAKFGSNFGALLCSDSGCPAAFPYISQYSGHGSDPRICYQTAAYANGASNPGHSSWCCLDDTGGADNVNGCNNDSRMLLCSKFAAAPKVNNNDIAAPTLYGDECLLVATEPAGCCNSEVTDNSTLRNLDITVCGPDSDSLCLPAFVAGGDYWVRIEWPFGHAQFRVPAGSNIFEQALNQSIAVANYSGSAHGLNTAMAADGAVFCHACFKGAPLQWGDTCWALTPAGDTNRDCGCSGGSWTGEGIYYGGKKSSNTCSGHGGGFAGPKASRKQKGNQQSIGVSIYVSKASHGCEPLPPTSSTMMGYGADKIAINFQPATVPALAAPYLADYGLPYGPKRGGHAYGWNFDISGGTRDRYDLGTLQSTHITPNQPRQLDGTESEWRIELPAGEYKVEVVYSDQQSTVVTSSCRLQGAPAGIEDLPAGDVGTFSTSVAVGGDRRLTFRGNADGKCGSIAAIRIKPQAATVFRLPAANEIGSDRGGGPPVGRFIRVSALGGGDATSCLGLAELQVFDAAGGQVAPVGAEMSSIQPGPDCDPTNWTGYRGPICGHCKALVFVRDNGGTCEGFCAKQGRECMGAWDDLNNNGCSSDAPALGCDHRFPDNTTDGICQCKATGRLSYANAAGRCIDGGTGAGSACRTGGCSNGDFRLGDFGTDNCPAGSEHVSRSNCINAANSAGATTSWSASLEVGSWAHTPPGCFVHAANVGKSISPHYSTGTGSNNGRYVPVCQKVFNGSISLGSAITAGACQRNLDEEECKTNAPLQLGRVFAGRPTCSGAACAPAGCYVDAADGRVYWGGTKTGSCTASQRCICAETLVGERSDDVDPWLEVDLGAEVAVGQVVLWIDPTNHGSTDGAIVSVTADGFGSEERWRSHVLTGFSPKLATVTGGFESKNPQTVELYTPGLGDRCAADLDCAGRGVGAGLLSGECRRHCCATAVGTTSSPTCHGCANLCGRMSGELAAEISPVDSVVWNPATQPGYGATQFKRRLVVGLTERLEFDAALLSKAMSQRYNKSAPGSARKCTFSTVKVDVGCTTTSGAVTGKGWHSKLTWSEVQRSCQASSHCVGVKWKRGTHGASSHLEGGAFQMCQDVLAPDGTEPRLIRQQGWNYIAAKCDRVGAGALKFEWFWGPPLDTNTTLTELGHPLVARYPGAPTASSTRTIPQIDIPSILPNGTFGSGMRDRCVHSARCVADYDSGWFSMSSRAGSNSYKELVHGLGGYPAAVKVDVKATDGNNAGYVFSSMGAAQQDDDSGQLYGGVISAFDNTSVRLWAPDPNDKTSEGSILAVADGWGGEVNSQHSQSASVRVRAWRPEVVANEDYNSGWVSMSSQAGSNSYKELVHGLGGYPAAVQVDVKAVDGNNTGFVFSSMGAAQQDDDSRQQYGGVVSAFDGTSVRLWAPDRNNDGADGRIINVGDGWGGEVNSQHSQSALVRVRAWRPEVVANEDYNSGWVSMSSQAGSNSYKELVHGLGGYPAAVQVDVKAVDGKNTGFVFSSMGAAQQDDDSRQQYGGVVSAFDGTSVRLWAPDRNNGEADGRIINVGDGWGGEVNSQHSQSALVRVRAWHMVPAGPGGLALSRATGAITGVPLDPGIYTAWLVATDRFMAPPDPAEELSPADIGFHLDTALVHAWPVEVVEQADIGFAVHRFRRRGRGSTAADTAASSKWLPGGAHRKLRCQTGSACILDPIATLETMNAFNDVPYYPTVHDLLVNGGGGQHRFHFDLICIGGAPSGGAGTTAQPVDNLSNASNYTNGTNTSGNAPVANSGSAATGDPTSSSTDSCGCDGDIIGLSGFAMDRATGAVVGVPSIAVSEPYECTFVVYDLTYSYETGSNQCNRDGVVQQASGSCPVGTSFIDTDAGCAAAASSLGLPSTTVYDWATANGGYPVGRRDHPPRLLL